MIELYTDKEIAESRQKYIDYLEGKSNVLFDFSLITRNGFVLHFTSRGVWVNNEGNFTDVPPRSMHNSTKLLKKYCEESDCLDLFFGSSFLHVSSESNARKHAIDLILSPETYIFDLTDRYHQTLRYSFQDPEFRNTLQKLRKEKLND